MNMKSDIPGEREGERVNGRVKMTRWASLPVPLEYRIKWKRRKQQEKRKGISIFKFAKLKRKLWTNNKLRMTKKKGQGQLLIDKERTQYRNERLKQTQKLVKKHTKFESNTHQRTSKQGQAKSPTIKNSKNASAKNKTRKSAPVIKSEPDVDLGKQEAKRPSTKTKKQKQKYLDEEGSCPTCGKHFNCSDTLFQHYTLGHTNRAAGGPEKARMEVEQERMQKHNANGNESRSVVCDQCGKEFYDATTAARHRRDIHEEGLWNNSEQFLQCPHCTKTYKSKDALGAHIRQMHEGQDFRCEVCNRKCQTSAKLWRHKRDDHDMRDLPLPPNLELLICSYCGMEMFRGLEAHVRKMHPDNLDEFRAQQKLDAKAKAMKINHVENVTTKNKQHFANLRKREIRRKIKELGLEEVRRQGMIIPDHIFKKDCRFCRRTILRRDFTNHLKNVHGIVEEGKDNVGTATDSLSLNQVIENRKLIKVWNRVPNGFNKFSEFICALCPEIRSRRVNSVKMHLLKEHMDALTSEDLEPTPTQIMLTSHPRPPPQSQTNSSPPTNCPHCSQTFSTEVELLAHAKEDHPKQCLSCPECSKLLISPEAVTTHFLIEHADNDNNEDVSLAENKTSTTEEKSSQSEESEFVTFFKVSMLTMAHTIHSKYRCKRCEIPSTTKSKLLQHVQEYHPGNFFLCPVENCGLVKFTIQGLYRHLDLAHPKNTSVVSDFTFMSVVPYKKLGVECPILGCNCVNKQKITLASFEQHLKKSHGINENPKELSQMLKCKICAEKHQSRLKFLVHMEEDHGHKVEMKEVIRSVTSRVIGSNDDGQRSSMKVQKFKGRQRTVSRTKAHFHEDVDRESGSDEALEVEEEEEAPRKILRKSSRLTRSSAKKNVRAGAVKVENFNETIFNRTRTKSCFVRVERLSESEIEQYLNRSREYVGMLIKQENCDMVDFNE